MTPEEIEAKRLADEAAQAALEVNPFAEKDAEIARLREERDNYRTAALARKGKLPADSEVFGEDFDAFIEEKVKATLADKEIARREQEKEAELRRMAKENAELKLALKNRPGSSIGGGAGSGGSLEVKDAVFTQEQLAELTRRAEKLKVDPVKFIENAKKNFSRNR